MPKTSQPNIERRFLIQEFRVSQDGESPKISGYAALFDTPSEDMGFTEEIDPHAFDSVLATNPDVRALFNHDANIVLGRTSANTLSLTLDARGLAYEIDPPDTQAAKDLIVSMRRKDITQSSFGFICKRDQWTENQDGTITRRILEFQREFAACPRHCQLSCGRRSQLAVSDTDAVALVRSARQTRAVSAQTMTVTIRSAAA
jgi:HK97 family phage prohead protease